MLGLKKADLKDFNKHFMIELDNHLNFMFMNSDKSVQEKLRAFMAELWGVISYSKPISRSVIAHMAQIENEINIFCHKDLWRLFALIQC